MILGGRLFQQMPCRQ